MHQLWGIENFEEQKSTSTQACIVFVLYWHGSLKKKKEKRKKKKKIHLRI